MQQNFKRQKTNHTPFPHLSQRVQKNVIYSTCYIGQKSKVSLISLILLISREYT